MTSHLDITVIIPCADLNSERLSCALHSVLRQTLIPNQILIVDNSIDELVIDNTLRNRFENLGVIRTNPHIGAAAARNLGVKSAISSYIAFLDSDDEWMPQKLEIQFGAMRKHNINISTTSFFFKKNKSTTIRPFRILQYPEKHLSLRCHMGPGSTLIVSKELFERSGGFDENLFRFEDWDFFLNVLNYDPCYHHMQDIPLAIVTRNPNTSWHDAEKSLRYLQAKWVKGGDRKSIEILSGVYFELFIHNFREKKFLASLWFLLRSLRRNKSHLKFLLAYLFETVSFAFEIARKIYFRIIIKQ